MHHALVFHCALRNIWLLGVLLSLVSLPLNADGTKTTKPAQMRVEVVEEGRFVEVPPSELAQNVAKALKTGPSPELKLEESTRRIQASVGLKFGVRFRAIGVSDGYDPDFSIHLIPPSSVKVSPKPIDPLAFGIRGVAELEAIYVIESEDELLRGPWVFEVWHSSTLQATTTIELN